MYTSACQGKKQEFVVGYSCGVRALESREKDVIREVEDPGSYE